MHEGVTGGHLGKDKTLYRLKERFYWPGHYKDVQEFCLTCAVCATRKSATTGQKAPLGTITAGYPSQIMAVDLVGPLPESEKGNLYIMVVGDYYTRWMEAIPIPNQEAVTVAEKLVDEVFMRFSTPEQLHTDQGKQFESNLMKEICKLLNIHKTRTTPYHPQCDGLVERFNRKMLNMLASCAKENPFEWEKHIRKICMAYNSSIQASTGFTPFYLMFGLQAKLPIDVMYSTNTPGTTTKLTCEYAKSLQKTMSEAFVRVRNHTSKYHQRHKELYDKSVHGKPHKKGELVWLHTPPSSRNTSRKLYHPWSGPFQVVKQISESTYRIQQLVGRKSCKVVHFDRLKPCPPNIRLQQAEQPTSTTSDEMQNRGESTSAPRRTYIGEQLQLIDDDEEELRSTPTVIVDVAPVPPTSRYPQRERQPPQRYNDFVSH